LSKSKIAKVMKTRKLKSSSGKRVTKEHSSNRKQAVAIALRSSKS